MTHKLIYSAIFGMAVLIGGTALPAYGAVIYCNGAGAPANNSCSNGNIYTVSSSNVGGNAWIINVQIDTTGYSLVALGAQSALGAIEIRDFSTSPFTINSFTATGSFYANASVGFATTFDGLSANGCSPNDVPSNKFCADAGEADPFLFNRGDVLNFAFGFTTTGTINDFIHVKNQFLQLEGSPQAWAKVGSLGSFDIYREGRIPPQEIIPEPATYALIGSALVGVEMLRRRRKS